MSHIATCKSQLKGVDPAMISSAFAALLQQHEAQGWKATETVYDYNMRNPTKCIAGVITEGNERVFPYGVGVNVNANGELEYVGDLSMQPWQGMKQELENYYIALGYMGCGEATVETFEASQATDVQIELTIEF